MLKKQLLLLLTVLCCLSCCYYDEDEAIDITVMPPATTVGAETFGCLIDGWLYVGGRYYYVPYLPSSELPDTSIKFEYDKTAKEMNAAVMVKAGIYIRFTIVAPQEGAKPVDFINARFGEEKLKDGKVIVARFDEERNIISGTFEGGRMEHGCFDVHYKEVERPKEQP